MATIKNLLFVCLMMFTTGFVSLGFTSCSNDSEPELLNTSESSIIGKWTVQSVTETRSGDSGSKYGSFEFTEDNRYIITQPTTISGEKVILIISGEYEPSGSGNEFMLNLSDFGTIKISIDDKRASITIDGIKYVAVKSKPVDLSENNKKLIGTWNVEFADNEGIYSSGEIIFTSSGTYLGMVSDGDTGELIPNNGTWSLSGNTITLEYTSYEYSNIDATPGKPVEEPKVTVIQEKDVLTVTELTDSKFIFTVTYIEDGYSDNVTMTGTKSK